MPIPPKYLVDFEENNIYHVFNRTNNKEKLFLNDDNRLFFLKQYAKYISPVANTFCWCLLPNHFHFLIQIKPESEIVKALQQRVANLPKVGNPCSSDANLPKVGNPCSSDANTPKVGNPGTSLLSKTEKAFLQKEKTLSELVEFYFKSFFQSYSLAFNKVTNRKGNLFYKPFKRVVVDKESYFTSAIIYIHANPVKHKLVKDLNTYKWSSYQSLLADKFTLLSKQEVLDWFGGIKQFINVHKNNADYYYAEGLAIEDD
jgi:putative transposase